MSQNKKIGPLRIIAINLITIVIILLCLEGAARVFIYFTRGCSTIGLPERTYYLGYRAFVMQGPDWQEILNPAKYAETKGGKKVCRILLLGGSVAAHYPPQLLEQAFAKKFPGREFEVIDASSGNYIARQEVIIASIWGVPLKPDIIISLDGSNDQYDKSDVPKIGTFDLDSAYELALKHPFRSPFAHMLRHSQLIQGIRRLQKRFKVSPIENFTDSIPVYISAQHSLNILAKGLSATRIMVLQPYSALKEPLSEAEANFKFYKYCEPVKKELFNIMNEELKKLAERDNVLYGDSRFIFKGIKTTIFSDDVHFVGNEGYRLLSEFIAGLVSEKDLK